jgi:hypothetical protein
VHCKQSQSNQQGRNKKNAKQHGKAGKQFALQAEARQEASHYLNHRRPRSVGRL